MTVSKRTYPMKMIKSLKYVLVAAVVALGLSACDTPFDEIKTLDLNRPFEDIRAQLDGIVLEHFAG